MLFSKEYVGYLARQVTQKLIAGEFIQGDNVPAVTEARILPCWKNSNWKTESMTRYA